MALLGFRNESFPSLSGVNGNWTWFPLCLKKVLGSWTLILPSKTSTSGTCVSLSVLSLSPTDVRLIFNAKGIIVHFVMQKGQIVHYFYMQPSCFFWRFSKREWGWIWNTVFWRIGDPLLYTEAYELKLMELKIKIKIRSSCNMAYSLP